MPDSTLSIKVQSIGVVDALLTASLLSGLVFQSGVVLWKNLDDYFEASTQKDFNGGGSGETTSDTFVTSNETISFEAYWFNDTSRAASLRGLRWWWWLFHDVVFGVGLALILGAALALIRSTSLKIHPSQAIKLVRIWLLGNILVVVIISMSFVSVVFTSNVCGGLDLVLGWSIFYLAVRAVCAWVVWKYLKDLTRQLPTTLITTNPRPSQ